MAGQSTKASPEPNRKASIMIWIVSTIAVFVGVMNLIDIIARIKKL